MQHALRGAADLKSLSSAIRRGAQYVGMGSRLYERAGVFRAAVDRVAAALEGTLDVRDVLFHKDEDVLAQTRFTQPALFTVGYALATLLESLGVRPWALIGHSVGELVAATLAGVLSVEDAARLVCERGRLVQSVAPGSMLSVRLPAERLRARLSPRTSVATENGPSLCVASGPTEEIEALERALLADGIVAKRLHTSHAFHSPMMEGVVGPFTDVVRGVPLAAPKTRIVSTVTGTWLSDEEARDPAYWGRHLREPVLFARAIATILKEPGVLLLEAGPRGTLSTLARQQITDRDEQLALATLADAPEHEEPSLLSALGQLWTAGVPIDFSALHTGKRRRRVPLPTYPFERTRHWVDPAEPVSAGPALGAEARAPTEAPRDSSRSPAAVLPPNGSAPVAENAEPSTMSQRLSTLKRQLAEVFEETSGIEIGESDENTSFVELGFDSLFLTQVALAVGRKFGVTVTFRQLVDELPSLEAVAEYMDSKLPKDAPAPPPPPPLPAAGPAAQAPDAAHPAGAPAQGWAPTAYAAPLVTMPPGATPTTPMAPMMTQAGVLQALIQQQMQLMTTQLLLLQGGVFPPVGPASTQAPAYAPPMTAPASSAAPPLVPPSAPASPSAAASAPRAARATLDGASQAASPGDDPAPRKPFGAIARISTSKDEISPKQKARLEAFVRRYTARTRRSKEHTQENRAVNADPRVVTGFRPAIKEIVYPIVVQRSKGSRLWDLDGNEYVDCLNGFGCNLFGWSPDFVVDAVKKQLDEAFDIGPQTPLAAECAKIVCRLTGFDRAAFCNTGSEAVLGTLRIARTVTGRQKIALFSGSYHGIFDEVIVRATKRGAVPAAPGIMPQTSQNVLVLEYGTKEALATIEEHADELAAVLVEPVQSRRPDFRPKEFLHAVRDVTLKSGTVLVFDEVITGFRAGNGGAQEYYGIRADLGSYGKVIGGGMPVGIIAGKRQYMDALDGGFWQFGDASMPTVGVTYFAGTFVRHPLALAAVRAVGLHLEEGGGAIQKRVDALTTRLAAELNAHFKAVGAPLEIRWFSSLWRTTWLEEHPFGDLLFAMLRDRGLHIMDGFPCFLTTAHTDADVDFIVKAFKESVAEMQESGFLPEPPRKAAGAPAFDASRPPAPGARLGRDPSGNPAWYVQDGDRWVKHEGAQA
jgi:glutamate-1-semialdehyde aminotransferase/malonyl CoA-acyl carrier protein transacylase